jgi:hypothetical protein
MILQLSQRGFTEARTFMLCPAFLNVSKRTHTLIAVKTSAHRMEIRSVCGPSRASYRSLVPIESKRSEMNAPIAAFTLAPSVIRSFGRLLHAKELKVARSAHYPWSSYFTPGSH